MLIVSAEKAAVSDSHAADQLRGRHLDWSNRPSPPSKAVQAFIDPLIRILVSSGESALSADCDFPLIGSTLAGCGMLWHAAGITPTPMALWANHNKLRALPLADMPTICCSKRLSPSLLPSLFRRSSVLIFTPIAEHIRYSSIAQPSAAVLYFICSPAFVLHGGECAFKPLPATP
ncbi:hypothetical protein CMQ_3225 [Grosmannia clavigera kw1407]|uniref:Uncharacterized protein n=1 Tax=Grosmannia clavigera (strain kw1407 / UAMH 11150) TaxID=655863 RepID=F0XH52_GROCL|nr:uncharacterized protein CMQ_3225 [Grosmannia clavigera kw1407]EFX03296.1 hypothetical protein CMQ_3225 [Grosmannia clavigera kw1407]